MQIQVEIASLFEPFPGDLYDAIDVGAEGFDEETFVKTLRTIHLGE